MATPGPKADYRFDRSLALFNRATKTIPTGIYGHVSPVLMVPGASPYYAAHGKGARYWDVDGNEYLDFMCAYGPMVIGYAHPEVDRAAAAEREKGMCFNHPSERQIELAEKLVSLIPTADWAVFAKNGSDTTSWAVQVAREYTGRRKVLAAAGAYHGAHAWCTPGHGGLIDEDRAHVHTFPWNDAAGLRAALDKYTGDVAAVILTPFHHPAFGDSVMPAPDFWSAVRSLCDRNGVLLIVDDVRAGFRLSLQGSAHYFGAKPDLVCFSKAIANGYPLAAAVGRDDLRVAASKVFLTGSFWNGPDAHAAALATLAVMEREGAIEKMRRMGDMLMRGLEDAARSQGLQVNVTGHPSMPNMTFSNEKDFKRMQVWSEACMRRGAFFHPHHNWFVSAAHEEEDIRLALDIADVAFKVVKDRFGG